MAVDEERRLRSAPRARAGRPSPGRCWSIDGALHPAIQPNGRSLHVRNGVGVADPDTAWFVICDEPVSFGRLARLFRDVLGCRDALYLRRRVSSLWDRPAGRMDAHERLGPLVAVFDRIQREEE